MTPLYSNSADILTLPLYNAFGDLSKAPGWRSKVASVGCSPGHMKPVKPKA